MRAILVAAMVALAGCQLQEPTVRGTVVAVHEVERIDEREDSGKYYEPPLVPEVAWKVEVLLEDGSAITVKHRGERRYEPGERVRVLLDAQGALLL